MKGLGFMKSRLIWIVLACVPLAAIVGACGGGGDSGGGGKASPNELLAAKKSPASLAADDAAWKDARVTTIKTSVVEGSKATHPVDVATQALYSGTDIWFRFEWADATDNSATRIWTYDGSGWKSSGNEDRLSLYWEITPIDGFQTKGCTVLCHNPAADPIAKWYMVSPGKDDRADNWHGKSVRTNTVQQADDKYLNGALSDPSDIESASKGDQKDSGGYVDNKTADGKAPAKMGATPGKPSVLVSEAVALDVSKLKAGDTVPRELLAPYVGSRGDIEAKGTWANGKWTLVFHRKLDTGHDDDVKLVPGKVFPFGLAVHDAAGAYDHTISNDVLLLKFK